MDRKEGKNKEDYIYCETCKMMVDFWKYDYSLEQAGHEDCKWRYVTNKGLKECIKECQKEGCFDEVL